MAKMPSVFMQALRPHTYQGHPKDVGDIYLAYDHDVENIENLKFAKQVPPPPRAVRARPVEQFIAPPIPEVPHGHAAESPNTAADATGANAAVSASAHTESAVDTSVAEPIAVPRRRRRSSLIPSE